MTEIDPARIMRAERVGSGVTATVYRGFLDGTDEIAVKVIEWNMSRMGGKQQQAFDREVAIMAQVRHPNLVNFRGVVSGTTPFNILTEFCSGGCVFELLHNDDDVELHWSQQHKMCLDIAEAIEYLHNFSPKIIHRDLKSLNLLLSKAVRSGYDFPFVKVSDFGLSRMQDTVGDAGVWGKMTKEAGTCHWMAPEVFSSNTYDERIDVYSYAMILFEIICREIPFEEEEPANVGLLMQRGERPDMSAVPPDVPEEMKDIMVASWNQDPTKRPDFTSIVQNLRPLIRTVVWGEDGREVKGWPADWYPQLPPGFQLPT